MILPNMTFNKLKRCYKKHRKLNGMVTESKMETHEKVCIDWALDLTERVSALGMETLGVV